MPTTEPAQSADARIFSVPVVEQLLHEGGHLPTTATVDAVTLRPLGDDQGYNSRVDRIELAYTPAQAGPETLIVKQRIDNGDPWNSDDLPLLRRLGTKMLLRKRNRYAPREGSFDRGPSLLRDVLGGAPVRVPELFGLEFDEEGHVRAALIEDVGSWRAGDQYEGLSDEELALGIREVCKMHVHTWNGAHLEGQADLPVEEYIEVRDIHLLWPYVHGKVKAVLGDDVEAYGSAWVRRVPGMMEDLSTRAHCLIHGDFHGDNVRFKGDDALILDFGESFRGNPMYDVSKIIMTSASRVPDEAMLRQGVETWHAAATQYGLEGYSLEQAWDDFRAVAPLDFALSLRIAIQPEDDERRRETSRRRSERVLGALRSLGELPAA